MIYDSALKGVSFLIQHQYCTLQHVPSLHRHHKRRGRTRVDVIITVIYVLPVGVNVINVIDVIVNIGVQKN